MASGSDLDWNDLRYFLSAAQHGSLAAAARAMGATHTTIGRRLSALERALGAPLVVRGPEGLRLTLIGEKLLPLAAELAEGVERARAVVAAEKARVRLAVPSGFSRLFAPELGRLARSMPGLALELSSGARPVDLARGEAELAVRGVAVTDADLVARKLCRLGWSVYAARSYLAKRPPNDDPTDFSGHAIVGFDRSLARGHAAQWLEPRCRGAQVVMRSREMIDLLAAAQSGAGLALLPCFLADGDPSLVRLTAQVVVSHDLWLAYRRELRLSKELRAVIRFVVEVVAESASQLAGAD